MVGQQPLKLFIYVRIVVPELNINDKIMENKCPRCGKALENCQCDKEHGCHCPGCGHPCEPADE